jgi:Amt family ammonium transporter
MNVLAAPSPGSPYIPEVLYAQFQSQFAAVTVGILLGAVAERARIFPTIVFTFVWTTLVYCPMVWHEKIFFLTSGLLDLEPYRMGI